MGISKKIMEIQHLNSTNEKLITELSIQTTEREEFVRKKIYQKWDFDKWKKIVSNGEGWTGKNEGGLEC